MSRNTDRRGYLTLAVVDDIKRHKKVLAGAGHQGSVFATMIDAAVIGDIDQKLAIEGSRSVALDLQALQERLNQLKEELVGVTASQTKGKKYIEKALRDVAEECGGSDEERAVLETILHPSNQPLFMRMAQLGIADFLSRQEKAERQFDIRDSWQAPESRFLELSEPVEGYTKCLYKPVLAGQFQKSDVELPFSRVLDSDPAVELWLKNGDNGQEHFAIKYEMNGEPALFFVDFIVRTVAGGYRLYDTKGAGTSELSTGNTADTHAKARALAAYISGMRQKGFDIDGGIVVRRDGQWYAHSGKDYSGSSSLRTEEPGAGWKAFAV